MFSISSPYDGCDLESVKCDPFLGADEVRQELVTHMYELMRVERRRAEVMIAPLDP